MPSSMTQTFEGNCVLVLHIHKSQRSEEHVVDELYFGEETALPYWRHERSFVDTPSRSLRSQMACCYWTRVGVVRRQNWLRSSVQTTWMTPAAETSSSFTSIQRYVCEHAASVSAAWSACACLHRGWILCLIAVVCVLVYCHIVAWVLFYLCRDCWMAKELDGQHNVGCHYASVVIFTYECMYACTVLICACMWCECDANNMFIHVRHGLTTIGWHLLLKLPVWGM